MPLRIVLIEDNTDARVALRMLLELSGHKVIESANGEDGLEKVLSSLPEAALIDIGLPKLNGYQIARRLRSLPECRGMLLIALTGYGRPEDLQKVQAAGFDAHFIKPLDCARLLSFLAERPRSVRAAQV
jgi:CheY-like chemotaxis protein